MKLNKIQAKKRGIEIRTKEIYFVENDNQTISSYKNEKINQKTNMI